MQFAKKGRKEILRFEISIGYRLLSTTKMENLCKCKRDLHLMRFSRSEKIALERQLTAEEEAGLHYPKHCIDVLVFQDDFGNRSLSDISINETAKIE